MAESFLNGKKTLWEKEKLLVMSNFSFSHSVFRRLVDMLKPGLVWERVKMDGSKFYDLVKNDNLCIWPNDAVNKFTNIAVSHFMSKL